jgi:hypothetical protein
MQKMQEHFSALRRLKRLLLVLYLLHNPHGWGECREMTGPFLVHAVVLTPLTYIPVGNTEEGQKGKSVAGVIKFTFLSFLRWYA